MKLVLELIKQDFISPISNNTGFPDCSNFYVGQGMNINSYLRSCPLFLNQYLFKSAASYAASLISEFKPLSLSYELLMSGPRSSPG